MAFMTTAASITSEQVRRIDAVASEPDDDGWLVMEFGLGPAN
jgi:hypothetical protein